MMKTTNILPQALDVEKTLLGAMIIEPACITEVVKLLNEDAFYLKKHQVVFRSLTEMYSSDIPVDIITLTEYLREKGKLSSIGGFEYIDELTTGVYSAFSATQYCAIIIEKYIKREIILSSHAATKNAFDDTIDCFDLLQTVSRSVDRINALIATGHDMRTIGSLMDDSEAALNNRIEKARKGSMTGIPTGILALDKITFGWQPSDLIVLAARPGMGKTASMLHFSKIAARSGKHVCIFSLEMSAISLTDRLILSECNIHPDRFRSGYMSDNDIAAFKLAKKSLSELSIFVDDSPVVSMRYVKAQGQIMAKKGHCDMIVIDYLQLSDMTSDKNGRNRENEVAEASRSAKIIAKTLNVPVMLLSQLSRTSEKRGGDFVPLLSDLRESGAIEQDADIVMFIHRPYYYDNNEENKGWGQFVVAKQRNGRVGTVKFSHNESLTRFYDFTETEEYMGAQRLNENIPF